MFRSFRFALALPVIALLCAGWVPARGSNAPAAKPAASPVLPWIDDDYSRALAEARARKLPIFVESWAPW
jgi:hypothetical protein